MTHSLSLWLCVAVFGGYFKVTGSRIPSGYICPKSTWLNASIHVCMWKFSYYVCYYCVWMKFLFSFIPVLFCWYFWENIAFALFTTSFQTFESEVLHLERPLTVFEHAESTLFCFWLSVFVIGLIGNPSPLKTNLISFPWESGNVGLDGEEMAPHFSLKHPSLELRERTVHSKVVVPTLSLFIWVLNTIPTGDSDKIW